MPIWDFSEYEIEKLRKAYYCCLQLQNLGFEQDEDMMAEIKLELKKRRL
jgi:ribosomal protein S6